MTENRITNERQRRILKTATKNLTRANGGIDGAAFSTRASGSTLGHYQNLQHESFAPIDVITDLELALGEPIVTKAKNIKNQLS